MDQQSEYKTAIGKIWDSAAWGNKMLRRQQDRQVARRRMRRQTFIVRDRFVVFGQKFLKVFVPRLFERKATANPIPAPYRLHVPKNKRLLFPDAHFISVERPHLIEKRDQLFANLRACCTKSQWDHLCNQYPLLNGF